jgi:hypothetical protein
MTYAFAAALNDKFRQAQLALYDIETGCNVSLQHKS